MNVKLAPQTDSLYDEVIGVTYQYLGPSAPKFIDSQISNHLHTQREEITKKDLLSLIDWIMAAFCLIKDDPVTTENFVSDLRRLASPPVTTT